MGCGCKGKKKTLTAQQKLAEGNNNTNSQTAIENRRMLVEEQKDYQGKVRDALKGLMELRQRKQRIPRK
tara:strand:+ start:322 stop:528 length:207 start_codon:yes stop_codon:yes gene_type:complete